MHTLDKKHGYTNIPLLEPPTLTPRSAHEDDVDIISGEEHSRPDDPRLKQVEENNRKISTANAKKRDQQTDKLRAKTKK